jgi:ABC-type branched-subunit amino acid transport system ATPase component
MPEPVLEVSGLRKEYGGLVAVDDIGFTVPEGGSLARVRPGPFDAGPVYARPAPARP